MIIEIKGLDEIIDRMKRFPNQYKAVVERTMQAVLLFIWSKVPSYPQAVSSTYIRTGTLGRSLGAGMSGKPDIYEVKKDGGFSVARFGTSLGYAPYVIGDRELEQATVHKSRWWTIPQTLFNIVEPGIRDKFRIMAEEIARWLEGK